MRFSYAEYCNTFLLFPVLCLLFVLPTLFSSVKALMRLIADSASPELEELFERIFPIIIIVGLAWVSISGLTSGAALLFTENEASALEASGILSDIEKVGKYEYRITVADTVYTIIDIGDYQEGDTVSITYLPNSRYVLSLQKDEGNCHTPPRASLPRAAVTFGL